MKITTERDHLRRGQVITIRLSDDEIETIPGDSRSAIPKIAATFQIMGLHAVVAILLEAGEIVADSAEAKP